MFGQTLNMKVIWAVLCGRKCDLKTKQEEEEEEEGKKKVISFKYLAEG